MMSRYRLPASQRAAASRLDAIAGGLLADTLAIAAARDAAAALPGSARRPSPEDVAAALGTAGGTEEICVRRARVAVRMRPSESDPDVAARWGVGVTDAIRKAVEEADPANVVRYASRAHAILDLAWGAATGDLTRQWAWRQLGLWSGPPPVSQAAARIELSRALLARPASVVPALSALARRGVLRPLVEAWSARDLGDLAEAALRAAGAAIEVVPDVSPGASAAAARLAAGVDGLPAAGRGSGVRPAVRPTRDERGDAGEAPRDGRRTLPHDPGDDALGGEADGGGEGLGAPDLARQIRAKADRALAASPLGAFLAGERGLPAASMGPLAALAALDAEPASMRASVASAEGLAAAIAEAARAAGAARRPRIHSPYPPLRAVTGDVRAPDLARRTSTVDPRPSPARDASGAPAASPARAPRDARDAPPPPAAEPGAAHAPAPPGAADRAAAPSPDAALAARSPSREADAATRAPASPAPSAAPPRAAEHTSLDLDEPPPETSDTPWDLRSRGFTEAGGLLFLLHVVDELGLAETLAEDPVLGARPLRWALHRLAVLLGEVAEDDPAALAFAGLMPGAEPPSALHEPAGGAEHEALARHAARLVARLRERLAGGASPDGAPGAARELLLRVTRRRAEIVADPGWIEVHLSLDQVRTDVRRAGLDLHPDHLPWLGVVVRFVYA